MKRGVLGLCLLVACSPEVDANGQPVARKHTYVRDTDSEAAKKWWGFADKVDDFFEKVTGKKCKKDARDATWSDVIHVKGQSRWDKLYDDPNYIHERPQGAVAEHNKAKSPSLGREGIKKNETKRTDKIRK